MTLYKPEALVPNLYYAVYEAASRYKSAMPIDPIQSGTHVTRSIEREHRGVSNTYDTARTIFNGRLSRTNRWTGGQPGGHLEPGSGGLYVALHTNALFNESLHYSREIGEKRFGAKKLVTLEKPKRLEEIQVDHVFYEFEVLPTLRAVNLDLSSSQGQAFARQVESDKKVQAALKDSGLAGRSLAQLSLFEDFSVSRALGNAAFQKGGAEALIVPSARKDFDANPGLANQNAVIGGPDNQALRILAPVCRILVVEEPGQVVIATDLPL